MEEKESLARYTEPQESSQQSSPNVAQQEEKLGWGTIIGYSVGEISLYVSSLIFSFFFNTFLLEVAEVPAFAAGNILLIAKIWDAFCDVIVGKLTDVTRSRWGRRRVWLLFGGIPFGISYFLLWQVPSFIRGDEDLKIAYYVVTLLLFSTASTCVVVPYLSLLPELTSNYDQRTMLTMLRFACGLISGVIATFLHAKILDLCKKDDGSGKKDLKLGYAISGIVYAVLIGGAPYVTFFLTKEKFNCENENTGPVSRNFKEKMSFFLGETKSFLVELWQIFTLKPFFVLMIVYTLCWVSINFVQNNLLLYVKYVLDTQDAFSWMVLLVQASTVIALVFWWWVTQKIGKKYTFYIGGAYWSLILLPLLLLEKLPEVTYYFYAFLAGVGVAIGFLIPWAMLPDVVDYDEWQHKKRREGMFFSCFVFLQKVGLAVSLALSNYILGATGYKAPENDEDKIEQPHAVIWALKGLVGIIPPVLLFFSLITMAFFPITKEMHGEILNKLNQEKAATTTTNVAETGGASKEQQPLLS
eukprot:TRINITY_DN3075_c0_g1_i1.p1 TRINITY_DN3075_c0_g1~~TRINITY_DN3075_c0_g1_i1.p1  ORF type:complete len:527 (-),score=138.31 TRINITY_DN3075_c0_g1_i1:55-1635(-)